MAFGREIERYDVYMREVEWLLKSKNMTEPKIDHSCLGPLPEDYSQRLSDLMNEGKWQEATYLLIQKVDNLYRNMPVPVRNYVMPDEWYQQLDPGIRFAVRVLHAAGVVETCQSCQGGEGHAYDRPSIDMIAMADDAMGFHAVAVLHSYGLPVQDLQIVWEIRNGLPYEKLWRVTFSRTMEDRADDKPTFIYSYQAQ